MKLNSKNQLGLKIEKNHDLQIEMLAIRTQNIQDLGEAGGMEHVIDEAIAAATELILRDVKLINHNYLIRETAMEMVRKIPINAKFDIKFLKNVPTKKGTFLLGDELAFRYFKIGNTMNAVFFETEYQSISHLNPIQLEELKVGVDKMTGVELLNDDVMKGLSWKYINIDLETGEIKLPTKESQALDAKAGYYVEEKPMKDEYFKLFVQLLLFIELSDLKVHVLEPNQKTGTRKTGKYINESDSNVSIVDSKWNVVSVRTESFLVSGHWRMQPCGVGHLERKLIFVDTFEKKGYTRRKQLSTTNI